MYYQFDKKAETINKRREQRHGKEDEFEEFVIVKDLCST